MKKKRYKPVDDGFSTYIEDLEYVEDKHEGYINNVFECADKLNKYDRNWKKLTLEYTQLKNRFWFYEKKLEKLAKENKKIKQDNSELHEKNKQLIKLISNSCVGREETLDGYQNIYTFTETELNQILDQYGN